MNILLIGFKYLEIEEIQDNILAEFPEYKIDFAISPRDSWYRLRISSYDLIFLDATSSDTDSTITYDDVSSRSTGIPIVLLVTENEVDKFTMYNGKRPKYIVAKNNSYMDKLISLIGNGGELSNKNNLYQQLKLKQSRLSSFKLLDAALNSVSDSILVIDGNFDIIEVNQAFADSERIDKKKIIGKPCHEILSKYCDDWCLDDESCIINNVFKSGKEAQFNKTVTNGTIADVNIHLSPVTNEYEQVEYVLVTITMLDKTQQKSDLPTVYNKNLLEVMLNGLSDGVLFCNSLNTVILMNQSAEYILQLNRKNVIGKSIFNLPLGDGSNWIIDVLKGHNRNIRFNSMAIRTDLNDRTVQIRFAPVYDNERVYLGGFLYLTEIETQKFIETNKPKTDINTQIFDLQKIISPKIIAEG